MPKRRLPGNRNVLCHASFLMGASQMSDGQLLDLFTIQRDEAAFEVLVRRYGPMVFGACNRVLRHVQDSEDAFQATFLVLAQRAAAVRRNSSLANWLYGVALRTAMQARGQTARRRRLECEAPPAVADCAPDVAANRANMEALIDEELQHLPARYREPIVLCDLMGKTKRQAAQELKCPEGTVSSRLARGRALLRKRLAPRWPAFGMMPEPLVPTAPKALPPALYPATAKAAGLLAIGGLAGTAPYALMKGVLKSMWYARVRTLAALALAVLILGGASGLVAWTGGQGDPLIAQDKKEPASKSAVADAGVGSNVKRERLRYDGKDFAAWKDILETELKPAIFAPAVDALAAFATNDYEEESIPLLISVFNKFDASTPTRDDVERHIIDVAEAALKLIGPKALPRLGKEFGSANLNHRRWGARLLFVMSPEHRTATRAYLFQALKDSDSWVHSWALAGIAFPGRTEDAVPKEHFSTLTAAEKQQLAHALAKAFLSGNGEPCRFLSSEAVQRYERLLTEKAKLGFKMEGGMGIPGAPPSASEIWYVALMGMGPEARSEFSKLVKGLESEDLRGQTIAILGEMGPDVAKSAIPDIVKSLKADDPSVRQAIIALGKMGPAANAAVPALRALLAPPLPKEIIDLGNDALKKIEGK